MNNRETVQSPGAYSLIEHALKVSMANPREQRGATGPIFEP
jgi:hypothetical protein